jgi:hypothetical protein
LVRRDDPCWPSKENKKNKEGDCMSYCEAMEAAGAEVLCYESFGSYQGDWWAKVTYEGNTFWVHGSYGSCSGCDAFEAEFWYCNEGTCDKHRYEDEQPSCEKCRVAKEDFNTRLADFGKSYLVGGEYTQEEAEKYSTDKWCGGEGQLEFLQANKM